MTAVGLNISVKLKYLLSAGRELDNLHSLVIERPRAVHSPKGAPDSMKKKKSKRPYDKKYSNTHSSAETRTFPSGLRSKADMVLRFSLKANVKDLLRRLERSFTLTNLLFRFSYDTVLIKILLSLLRWREGDRSPFEGSPALTIHRP